MSFFADTNIALGYTIIHDKWHENAKKLIDEKSDTIFWSNLVEKEYNVKICILLLYYFRKVLNKW